MSSFPFAPPGERVEEDTLCERDSLNNWDVDKELESSSAVRTYVKIQNTKLVRMWKYENVSDLKKIEW